MISDYRKALKNKCVLLGRVGVCTQCPKGDSHILGRANYFNVCPIIKEVDKEFFS